MVTADPDIQCKPVVEAQPDQGWFRVRPHENAFIHCTLTRETLTRQVQEFLSGADIGVNGFQSLSLGRLVDHPWLSRYLAEQALADGNWDAVRGMPRNGDINGFVRSTLTTPAALALLQSVFEGTGYTVTGVSVEKVLVLPANSMPWLETSHTELVPFDALTFVRLERN